jgi:hypothetical protein
LEQEIAKSKTEIAAFEDNRTVLMAKVEEIKKGADIQARYKADESHIAAAF